MDGDSLRSICQRYGYSPLSYLTLNPRLGHFTKKGIDGYIAWGRAGRTACALTDPMTAAAEFEELTGAFRKDRGKRGEHPVFFGVTERFDREFTSMGYHRYVLGRDSVLDAAGFSLSGNRMQNVRRCCNHARKSGLDVFELGADTGADMNVFREMHAISREWLRLKRTPELEHLLWKLDLAPNHDLRYFVARSAGRVEGFVTFNPVFPTGDWYLDLTRRRRDAANGVLDYLIVESLKILRADGMRNMYLGMVPDPGIHTQLDQRGHLMNGIVGMASNFSDMLYPVRGEHFFKEKYRPGWKDVLIYSAEKLNVWRLYDLLRFIQPDGLTGILKHKLAAAVG